MKISIKSEGFRFNSPLPLSMGGLAISCIPKSQITKEEKKALLQLYKSLKRNLKQYKGLKIVELISKDGDRVIIKI